MTQPDGFNDDSGRVCRLRKGLYGLRQAPRQWNGTFHKFLVSYGFEQSIEDPCLYRLQRNNNVIYLCLFVDDGLVFSSSAGLLEQFMSKLSGEFQITSSTPNVYVGMEIRRDRGKKTITVSQRGYIDRMLRRFGMHEANPLVTPSDPNVKLSLSMAACPEEEQRFPYREAVGSLNYVSVVSRPDITFSVGQVARFCEKPNSSHWKAVKRIFRYLKGTNDKCIVYDGSKGTTELVGYSDSDWGGEADENRSTSGFVYLLNNSPITWSSRLQKVTARSTVEAEYMALSESMIEVIWLRSLLTFLGVCLSGPTVIHVDNRGAICLSKNPVFHKRTKHIGIQYHRVRQEQELGTLKIEYIESKRQVADFLTKALNGNNIINALEMVGMRTMNDQEEVLGI